MNDFLHQIETVFLWLTKFGAYLTRGMARLLYAKGWIHTAGKLFTCIKFGRYPEQIITSGSHIDTVVNRVNFDGQYGVEATHLYETNKISYRLLHRDSGHDAQFFAPRVPSVMMFVPSIAGMSHRLAEKNHLEDFAEGVNTLTQVLYQLAYTENGGVI